ncbi:MAG TPA: ferric reductase-like transmembrane domain-containing protein [Candidatus Accumulibacter phosphatis]|nr:MAG: Naphthalene 1,2-dioxygenase/salicylate 5-hydroxylase systems, ferredoxin--NAD(P)(+) reductase component [Candidatus Accumulibacter sp. SK-11]HAY25988.1 oxidoreductase [Accumulibacter sp.]HRL75894.1 ferric reductase-like transmembrane domain-containing protein [Candidatus Accumulibacter phosphatis]HCN70004.1 oxidoreductase [Accumulibacter sp.]HCV14464.1 oxidoreductase [Accumulibacter sp.]
MLKSTLHRLPIPLLLLTAAVAPVYWALPEDLSLPRSLGIILGWAGCGLLLGSLLLMLRETWLSRWLGGLERMYQWHHRAGVVAYVMLLAHPLALAADSWPQFPAVAWQTLSPFGPGWAVRLGWLSLLLLMFGLACTFAARIPYRSWRWLHASLGIGVLLGLGHLLQLGIEEPVLPLLALATVLLGWRFIRDDAGLAARPYIVQTATPVADGVVEIALRPLAEPIAAAAGQFVLVAFLASARFRGCGQFHPYTVSSIGIDGEIRVGVKALGDCTRHLQSIEAGVPARIHGAFGSFLADRPAAPQLWLAGGIGVTPFLALLRAGPLSQPTVLVYLYRSEADAAYLPELRALAAADPLLSLHAQATGKQPPDVASLLPATRGLSGSECYLCGPPAMVAAVRQALRWRGVTARHIHYENFDFR